MTKFLLSKILEGSFKVCTSTTVNVLNHISDHKDKNNMSFSINTEKAFLTVADQKAPFMRIGFLRPESAMQASIGRKQEVVLSSYDADEVQQ